MTHGLPPTPTNTWFVPGGQGTKSHFFSGTFFSSTSRAQRPSRIRKSSCSDSRWYMQFDLPGRRTCSLIPRWGKERFPSNGQTQPNPSLCHQRLARAFTTNQPPVDGVSPPFSRFNRARFAIFGPLSPKGDILEWLRPGSPL